MSHQQGYIALVSVLILASVLLVVTSALAFGGYESRFMVLGHEYKRISRMLAEGCVHEAVAQVMNNPLFVVPVGGLVVPVGNNSCRICSVSESGGVYSILTRASQHGSVTNLRVRVRIDAGIVTTQSWGEEAAYGGSACIV